AALASVATLPDLTRGEHPARREGNVLGPVGDRGRPPRPPLARRPGADGLRPEPPHRQDKYARRARRGRVPGKRRGPEGSEDGSTAGKRPGGAAQNLGTGD